MAILVQEERFGRKILMDPLVEFRFGLEPLFGLGIFVATKQSFVWPIHSGCESKGF